MPTLKQIADASNVSITTVSRVLNDDKSLKVSQETRDTILSVAKALGYAKKKQKVQDNLHIGIVLWVESTQEIEDPYFMEIRHGIEREAEAHGIYFMTLYREARTYNFKKLDGVDGLILVGKFTDKEVRSFERKSQNLVFVDSSPAPTKYDSVMIDYYDAMEQIIAYAIQSKYQTIGYIGGQEKINDNILDNEPRGIHFKTLLEKYDRYHPAHVYIGEFTSQSGYDLMLRAIKNNHLADSYFCASDSMAIGAMKALHENNIKIPKDVAIIGFNDIAQARYIYPALTTLKVPTTAMGEEAFLSLLDKLKYKKKNPVKKIVPTTLIKRESA